MKSHDSDCASRWWTAENLRNSYGSLGHTYKWTHCVGAKYKNSSLQIRNPNHRVMLMLLEEGRVLVGQIFIKKWHADAIRIVKVRKVAIRHLGIFEMACHEWISLEPSWWSWCLWQPPQQDGEGLVMLEYAVGNFRRLPWKYLIAGSEYLRCDSVILWLSVSHSSWMTQASAPPSGKLFQRNKHATILPVVDRSRGKNDISIDGLIPNEDIQS